MHYLVHLKLIVNFGIKNLTHVGDGNNINIHLDMMLKHCNNYLKDMI